MVSRTQLERVQNVQTLTLKWIIGDECHKDDRRYLNRKEHFEKAGGMSLKQMVVYHSLMLLWKVNKDSSPKSLVGQLQKKRLVIPRIEITERCWSRTSERWQDQLDTDVMKNDRNAPIKTYLKDFVCNFL